MTDQEIPSEIHFKNGGRLTVQMVENGWVFYALYHPGSEDPCLYRKTIEGFRDSVQYTHEKIVSEMASRAPEPPL